MFDPVGRLPLVVHDELVTCTPVRSVNTVVTGISRNFFSMLLIEWDE